MLSIKIKEIDNGFVVTTSGSSKYNGEKVYRGIDDLFMLQQIVKAVNTKFRVMDENELVMWHIPLHHLLNG